MRDFFGAVVALGASVCGRVAVGAGLVVDTRAGAGARAGAMTGADVGAGVGSGGKVTGALDIGAAGNIGCDGASADGPTGAMPSMATCPSLIICANISSDVCG